MRNYNWRDVLERLKSAQNVHKMNIRKQDLTEIGTLIVIIVDMYSTCSIECYRCLACVILLCFIIDVYHRILRFRNYMVAMINKDVLSYKIWIPFYGEK